MLAIGSAGSGELAAVGVLAASPIKPSGLGEELNHAGWFLRLPW
jgi:hypothetical protein